MMMISTGISDLLQLQPRSSRRLRRPSSRYRTRSISKITAISHGCADAILWISSPIWLGIFILIWRPQMNLWVCSIWSPMTAIKWDNSISQSKPLMFSRDLTQIPSSGREREELPSEYSRWLLPEKRTKRDSSRLFRCSKILIILKLSTSFRLWRNGVKKMDLNSDILIIFIT